jgi:hypothetical protein
LGTDEFGTVSDTPNPVPAAVVKKAPASPEPSPAA